MQSFKEILSESVEFSNLLNELASFASDYHKVVHVINSFFLHDEKLKSYVQNTPTGDQKVLLDPGIGAETKKVSITIENDKNRCSLDVYKTPPDRNNKLKDGSITVNIVKSQKTGRGYGDRCTQFINFKHPEYLASQFSTIKKFLES